ncbi:MAG TPA: TatD family hydrolase [Candidatus Nanoarchaeia archaeon]|nr:TatD family hydrolase [Candidatus Nanoarchaeia archaeon]
MAFLIDVHCHLDLCEDIDSAVERAKEAGVCAIIANGTNPESNLRVLELAKKYDIVKAALGIYPLEGLELSENAFDDLLKFIEKHKDQIIALGEVGVDYHTIKDKNEEQKENFLKIIRLSEKIKKPMIVHSRKAESDVLDILESSNVKKAVMHCFNGNMKLVKRAEDLGYYFSIPTNIVSLKHFQEVVERVQMERILTETDAPWLSPFKGGKNEPAFVAESIKKIAETKKMTHEEIANVVYMNYQRVF